jgi:hypothetical protein
MSRLSHDTQDENPYASFDEAPSAVRFETQHLASWMASTLVFTGGLLIVATGFACEVSIAIYLPQFGISAGAASSVGFLAMMLTLVPSLIWYERKIIRRYCPPP